MMPLCLYVKPDIVSRPMLCLPDPRRVMCICLKLFWPEISVLKLLSVLHSVF